MDRRRALSAGVAALRLIKRHTQIKNEISAVLHRDLKGRDPASDPFGKKGRAWIAEQRLPIDERRAPDRRRDLFANSTSSAKRSRRSTR
ncbi:MAG: hypothetical protein ACXVVQ_13295 [Solirubrobacteraceae bacterium]